MRRPRLHRPAIRPLAVEPLEGRTLLAGVALEGCTLQVEGTLRNDQIRVAGDGDRFIVDASFLLAPKAFSYADVRCIEVVSRDGQDRVDVNVATPPDLMRLLGR